MNQAEATLEFRIAQLFQEWMIISAELFPDANAGTCLEKLRDEIIEVERDLESETSFVVFEYVDCFMCLLTSLAKCGIDMEKLSAAFSFKMRMNLERNWKKNTNGTYSHDCPKT